MCIVTLISIAIDRPFTLDFARDAVSPQVAALPEFLQINKEISLRWSGALAVIAAATSIAVALDRPFVGPVATIVVLFWVVRYTKRAADLPSVAVIG